ncbi:hypothetical protein BU25DRAFT_136668 [Macroventuria anomochaeta]|uniref:Uncharacterized protein n=1 Tax=Macroventuria anomochaeta TaxID=301207 RepID=A0ACB6SEC9_9PLEO|nr:uncharacterized protein BU25DRAFT_136668 [Macroventuria anomochaeta]KAF2631960.1 hypothetical protein BU25DRAFT_136668 [Macroventuria anomochaeta]
MSKDNVAESAPPQPQLYIRETYFQTPKAVVPPNATPKKAITPTVRSVPATSPPRRDSKKEPTAEHPMGYETAAEPTVITLEEHETLKERLDALFRSTLRAVRKCLCSTSSELDDTESNTAHMLDSYRHHPIYGYGSISAGAKPTSKSDNVWPRAQRQRLSQEGLVAQPTPKGNFII